MQLILNGDTRPIPFFVTSSTDHLSGITGGSPTVTISKNGAAFAAPSGAVGEVGNGWYTLTPGGADVTTNGILLLHATASGADPSDLKCQVVAFNPYDAAALGLSRLDAAVSSRMATFALPANFSTLAVDGSGHVTAGTVSDKTGYALTTGEHTAIAADAEAGLTAQGYTTVRAAKLDNLDAAVSSRMATFTLPTNFSTLVINGSGFVTASNGGGGGSGPTVQQIVDGVFEEMASAHLTTGSFGKLLNTLATLAIDGSGAVSVNNFAAGLLDLANGIETGLTLRQAMRVLAAAEAGVTSGAGTTEFQIAAAGQPQTPRIAATVDTIGNRSAVTLTP